MAQATFWALTTATAVAALCATLRTAAAFGNGGATADPQNGMYALWGQDLTPLFGAKLQLQRRRRGNVSGYAAASWHHHQRA